MIRIAPSCSVWATARRRPEDDRPNVTKRLSSSEWSGSLPVADKGSKNTLDASSKDTPCFRRFPAAFSVFHSKRTRMFQPALSISGARSSNSEIEESWHAPAKSRSRTSAPIPLQKLVPGCQVTERRQDVPVCLPAPQNLTPDRSHTQSTTLCVPQASAARTRNTAQTRSDPVGPGRGDRSSPHMPQACRLLPSGVPPVLNLSGGVRVTRRNDDVVQTVDDFIAREHQNRTAFIREPKCVPADLARSQ